MKQSQNPVKITVITTDPSVSSDVPEVHSLQDCFPGHEVAVHHFDDPSLRQYEEQAASKLTARFPAPVMIPLFVPWIIADDRCLFLDADTVVVKDLEELYGTDLRGGVIGAVQDIGIMKQAEIYLSFTYRNVFKPSKVKKRRSEVLRRIEACGDLAEYFNSGVLLYDSKSIRKFDPEGSLKNIALSLKHDIFPDQDRLNEFFRGKVYFLDSKWNVYTAFHNRLPTADAAFHQNIRDAIRDPGILHFTALHKRRPWRRNWWNTFSRAKLRRYRIYRELCLEIEARTGIPIIQILDSGMSRL